MSTFAHQINVIPSRNQETPLPTVEVLSSPLEQAVRIAISPELVILIEARHDSEVSWIGQFHSAKTRCCTHRRLERLSRDVERNSRSVTNHAYRFLFISDYLPMDSAHEVSWI